MLFRILLVEDDTEYRDALCQILNLEGFRADGVGSVAAFTAWRNTHDYDLLIVDRQLPDGDGLDVLAQHRESENSPVIILTARGDLTERISALEADADYYLVKPFAMDELIALLGRLSRRRQSLGSDYWAIDPYAWRLCTPDGNEAPLNHRELQILLLFVDRPGQVIPRQDMITSLGENPNIYDPRRLEILIRRLRNKVEDRTSQSLPIKTIYGVGFCFSKPLRLFIQQE